MEKKKKKNLFSLIIIIASIILITIGSTFAYFSAIVSSNENAVSFGAAVFTLDLEDDLSLIKSKLIPSAEKYVDASTIQRLDENGDFVKPTRINDEFIYEETACIDDNLNEICSIYTFTVINTMTDMDLPLYITLIPTINTFDNLYFKVVDEEKNVVMQKTIMTKEENTDNPEEETNKFIALSGIKTLPKATTDKDTDEVIPTKATYSIIMWVDEIGKDQTIQDSGQVFAATLNIMTSDEDGSGITGVFAAGGTE